VRGADSGAERHADQLLPISFLAGERHTLAGHAKRSTSPPSAVRGYTTSVCHPTL